MLTFPCDRESKKVCLLKSMSFGITSPKLDPRYRYGFCAEALRHRSFFKRYVNKKVEMENDFSKEINRSVEINLIIYGSVKDRSQ